MFDRFFWYGGYGFSDSDAPPALHGVHGTLRCARRQNFGSAGGGDQLGFPAAIFLIIAVFSICSN